MKRDCIKTECCFCPCGRCLEVLDAAVAGAGIDFETPARFAERLGLSTDRMDCKSLELHSVGPAAVAAGSVFGMKG